jgi:hypothetical protein
VSLRDFVVERDRFEPVEGGALAFPCCICKHRVRKATEEPCRRCDHNCGAVEDAPQRREEAQSANPGEQRALTSERT